jgi:uncharacterized membrane protein
MAVVIGVGIGAIVVGLVLVWAAVAGWRGRLSRDRPVGVRTPSTLRSDEAFAAANKAAAPLEIAGGVVMVLGGVLAMVVPKHLVGVPLFSGILLGIALCVIGAAVGVRASK